MNLKQILAKLFCAHKWEVHAKKERDWMDEKIVENTENWYKPVIKTVQVNEVTEVLICEHCGNIKIIKY